MLLSIPAATACSPTARRGDTIVFASGADLQSINPLLTVHPLARQVQRYALLTTLVRYDSLMRPIPYLARSWDWAPDSTSLTFHDTDGGVQEAPQLRGWYRPLAPLASETERPPASLSPLRPLKYATVQ